MKTIRKYGTIAVATLLNVAWWTSVSLTPEPFEIGSVITSIIAVCMLGASIYHFILENK